MLYFPIYKFFIIEEGGTIREELFRIPGKIQFPLWANVCIPDELCGSLRRAVFFSSVTVSVFTFFFFILKVIPFVEMPPRGSVVFFGHILANGNLYGEKCAEAGRHDKGGAHVEQQ